MSKPHPPVPPAHPVDPKRHDLLATLGTMPDEAFQWFVLSAHRGMFPDGIGGFKPDAQASIAALRAAAKAYFA